MHSLNITSSLFVYYFVATGHLAVSAQELAVRDVGEVGKATSLEMLASGGSFRSFSPARVIACLPDRISCIIDTRVVLTC
jgi:hypothetical protein